MANVSINLLYKEIKQLHREVSKIRSSLIPYEAVSEEEHAEIRAMRKEIEEGRGIPWQHSAKK